MEEVDYIYSGVLWKYSSFMVGSDNYLFSGKNGSKSYFRVLGQEEDCVKVGKIGDSELIKRLSPLADIIEKKNMELSLQLFMS